MQLSEQQIVRRETLQKIIDLGFEPYPAAKFEVDFQSTEMTTAIYHKNLKQKLADIKGVGEAGAEKLLKAIFANRFRASKILADETVVALGVGETIEFDESVEREAMSFEAYAQEIKDSALGDYSKTNRGLVSIAGRFMGQRGPFAQLQDSAGRIQLYIGKKDLGNTPDEIDRYKKLVKLLDIGDFIGVKGDVFATGTGEVSIHVRELIFLGKSLRVLPIVKRDKEGNIYDEFKDPELRYRMRYVDLTVNPQYKDIFIKRSKVITSMRSFFVEKGWMEVETPILQPIHGGAAARPFKTHHNTLDMPLYLRIANELYLKRLIVAGFDGVFEFAKMFRNEGMDRTHNPEFTAMEIYVAYKDYIWMMEMVENCLEHVAMSVNGTTKAQYGDNIVDFKGPYRRLTMYDSIKEYTGIDVSEMDEAGLREVCKQLHIEVDNSMGKGKLIDEIFGEKVEDNLIQPTYITDYPIEMSPLAKKHRSKEGLVERFELFVNGKEIANAYSELNDPIDQRERFEEQLRLAARGDDEAMMLDEDFLRSLEYGMPPTSGLGIGIDRLVMMLTNQRSIQEVLFFPQMKPEGKNERKIEEIVAKDPILSLKKKIEEMILNGYSNSQYHNIYFKNQNPKVYEVKRHNLQLIWSGKQILQKSNSPQRYPYQLIEEIRLAGRIEYQGIKHDDWQASSPFDKILFVYAEFNMETQELNDIKILDEKEHLLKSYQREVINVSHSNRLYGLDGDVEIDNKRLSSFYDDIILKHRSKINQQLFDKDMFFDLLRSSQDIRYNIGEVLYNFDYITSYLDGKTELGGQIFYTYHPTTYDKNYLRAYSQTLRLLYSYWEKIAHLLNYCFNISNSRDVNFDRIIQRINVNDSNNYLLWLDNFRQNEYKKLNDKRRKIVHYTMLESDFFKKFLDKYSDKYEMEKLQQEKEEMKDFVVKQNELMFAGFEKALRLIDESL